MPSKPQPPLHQSLGLPSPDTVVTPGVREQYRRFLEQLVPVHEGAVVLSDPYFFALETDGITDSVEAWLRSIMPEARARLLLLSILCRPVEPAAAVSSMENRFIDDPVIAGFFRRSKISLAEGTSGVPFGISELSERRKASADPGLQALLELIRPANAIETFKAEFIGGQPGNYAYTSWQIAHFSAEWAGIYTITDAAYHEGYPFPWLLGFCRKADLERNFIELLREGLNRYDLGFYFSQGRVTGRWGLARLALAGVDDLAEGLPCWRVLDELLALDAPTLAAVLEQGPVDNIAFVERLKAILDAAYEAGFHREPCLGELLALASPSPSLVAVEQQLPEWQEAYEAGADAREQARRAAAADRQAQLAPFRKRIDAWVGVAAGPRSESTNARTAYAIRASHIRAFIEAYALEHGALPEGVHDIGPTQGMSGAARELDFTDIAVRAAATLRSKKDSEA